MKKIFSILFLLFVVMVAKAQYTELDIDQTDVLYIEGTVQTGTEGKLYLKMKNSDYIGTITSIFQLPEGIEMDANEVDKLVTSCGYEDGFYKLSYQKGWEASSEPVVIVELPVNVTAESGTYQINAKSYQMVHEDLTDIVNENVYTTITVQKAAIIDAMPEGYGFEIIPFTLSANEKKDITVYMKNALDVYNMDITVNLPEGISNQYTTNPRGAKTYTSAKLDNSNLYSTTDGDVTALTLKQSVTNSGATINYKLENEGGDSYLPTDDYVPAFTIPVVGSATLAEGIYNLTISLSKVNAIDYEDKIADGEFATYEYSGGEYLATVIVGQPSVQEAILYGNYKNATVEAFNVALKNVAVANITAVELLDGANFQDVLTVDDNKKWCYYYRKSDNYATTVMPYDLGVTQLSQQVCQLYRVESMTSESIVIKELAQGECIPANTPCIFKGTLSFLKENMPFSLGAIDDQSFGLTTFKGTYEATSIASGAGYYISDGKFYNDGATIRPFRAYFKGDVSGAKALQVLLEDETGIKDITDQFSTEEIYNLMGVKMNNAKKGVNIINGKKVYIK